MQGLCLSRGTALPPDVRQGFALPQAEKQGGLSPQKKARYGGASPASHQAAKPHRVLVTRLKQKRMQGLTAKEILSVWEAGQYQAPAERALTLLSTFCPDKPLAELERLSIGQRDELLLTLRELLFGSKFTATTACPLCCMALDLGFSAREVRIEAPDAQRESFI